jgi:uncharacterized protein YaaQ
MNSPATIDQLVIIIVSGLQVERLMKSLIKAGFYCTRIDNSGGIVQDPAVCLLVGLNQARLASLSALVREYCRSFRKYIPTQFNEPAGYGPLPLIEAQVGGALIYSMNVERFEQIK